MATAGSLPCLAPHAPAGCYSSHPARSAIHVAISQEKYCSRDFRHLITLLKPGIPLIIFDDNSTFKVEQEDLGPLNYSYT